MTDMPLPDEPSTSAVRPRERRARPAVRPGAASPLGRLTDGWTWRRSAVAGVLLLLVGTAGVLGYRRWNTTPAKEATVQTAPATKRTILEQVALPGTVASGRQSKLAFASSSSGTSVTGRVESISVKTGDTVKAGQELARLNTTSLDLAVQSANSAFTVAQLKLQQILAGATRSDLATAEQSIISANATLQKAQSDLRTLQGAPAAAEYASATQAVLNAQNALNNAQTALDNLQVHSSDAAALANAIKAVDVMTAQQHTAQTELDAGLDQLEAANAFSKGARGAANDLLNAVNAMCRSNATQCNGIARGATHLASLGAGLDAQLPPIPFAISPRVVAFNDATSDPALRSALFRLVQASAELPALTTEANGRVAVSGSSTAPTNEALRSAMSTRDAAAQALTAANAKLDLLMHPADADVQAAQNALKNAQAGLAAATAKRDATVGGPLPVDIAVQE
ncbi:MAG: biotin/lipoyl-binding protein, partial [Chloroflexota bacterium]